jgi:hypothetical protein
MRIPSRYVLQRFRILISTLAGPAVSRLPDLVAGTQGKLLRCSRAVTAPENIAALKLLGLRGGGTITLFANRNRKEVLSMNPQTLAYLAMAAIYIYLAFAH